MDLTNDEIYNILINAKSKKEACRKLNINMNHNKKFVDAELKKYCDIFNINIETIRNNSGRKSDNTNKIKYLSNPKYCPVCGKVIPFEKRGNRTCSQSCGTIISNIERGPRSQKVKEKISKTLREIKHKVDNYKNPIDNLNTFIEHSCDIDTTKYGKIKFFQPCKICGKIYLAYTLNPKNNNLQHSKFCSNECKTKNTSITSKERAQRRIKDGTFVGWKSRNITSYAEKFWKTVLDNNSIPYKREFYFCNKYFLDFYLEKNGHLIDLEIDGKQHEYKERQIHDIERDEFIKNNGLIVYRVKWNSINGDKGKQLMKEKIDKFLTFYNNL